MTSTMNYRLKGGKCLWTNIHCSTVSAAKGISTDGTNSCLDWCSPSLTRRRLPFSERRQHTKCPISTYYPVRLASPGPPRHSVKGEPWATPDKSRYSVEKKSFRNPTSTACPFLSVYLRGTVPLAPYPMDNISPGGRETSVSFFARPG